MNRGIQVVGTLDLNEILVANMANNLNNFWNSIINIKNLLVFQALDFFFFFVIFYIMFNKFRELNSKLKLTYGTHDSELVKILL